MKTKALAIEIPVSEDLKLREVSINDAPAIFSLIDTNREFLRKWLPFVDYSKAVSDTEAFIKSVTAEANTTDLVFAVLYQGQHVGVIGFKSIDLANLKLEIGYWLAENKQHNGIITRSCATLLRYAFEKMQMNRVQIKVGVSNKRSSSIPKKLHFTFEGMERDGELLANGQFHDLEVYSLLRREWERKADTAVL
ncbi:ribosomal-protein-serine acetyltransferase [Pontibacter aydingkolensis]|uniref:GNAT family N-acetyltransferase n=1 Tax=Pontibacter aydingkolensis TaxID=1911536 RepID=A0ABS7CUS9_9BACT|nr:GNAT family N-acetyltransferase [Pontibacter aydingkolensis]MBW7467613.1 GNAT family N-acetyltransferase [Pontibacter aydingkolensis]